MIKLMLEKPRRSEENRFIRLTPLGETAIPSANSETIQGFVPLFSAQRISGPHGAPGTVFRMASRCCMSRLPVKPASDLLHLLKVMQLEAGQGRR